MLLAWKLFSDITNLMGVVCSGKKTSHNVQGNFLSGDNAQYCNSLFCYFFGGGAFWPGHSSQRK